MQEKTYQPSAFEKDIYSWWCQQGYFKPSDSNDKPYFSMVAPPPNITGQLHLGHGMDSTIQDILVRYKRMKGYNTLWVPGTDHASIATEVKIVEMLKSSGIDKNAIGREEFLKHAWQWKEKYGNRIVEQLKLLGSSCDWDRLSFTMDDKCSRAVRHAFVKMYNDGLIYQGNRIINWCPVCNTALSDAEVEYEEQAGNFWHFSYYTKDGKDKVTFATTRPETMLGDTAVAVHPDDKRYAHLVGKTVIVPFVNREIPVIADSYVDMSFGTGVVKITPAHDPNDFEVGQRHNLPVIRVMNDDGTMNSFAGQFQGMDRYECRKEIVKLLTQEGNMKIEPHKHNVGTCYRCNTTVEPIVSKQWFVAMESLAKPAIDAVKNGDTVFHPRHYEKTYFNWMDNIKDWCISRQLWWGHRIPIWYCADCGAVICSETDITHCTKCNSSHIVQDPDVLDTWFSSALWPFSTLGKIDGNSDFDRFFPTSVLACGSDIIFFWVARMIFSSLYENGQVPFADVLMHGIVRDEKGRKMSKSLGNGIDPQQFISQYGADALRFALTNGIANGSDINFAPDKIEGVRNFMNKLWNASRFVLLNCQDKDIVGIDAIARDQLTPADKWIVTRLQKVIAECTSLMDKYEFGLACQVLYNFVWSEFCDWYIELSKPVLYGTDESQRNTNLSILVYVLDSILKLLHPIVPFVTEKIYQELPIKNCPSIMIDNYPVYDSSMIFESDADLMSQIMELITKIRNIRAEYNVIPSKRIKIAMYSKVEQLSQLLVYIEKLSNCEISLNGVKPEGQTVTAMLTIAEVIIPLGDLVDKEKEIIRLNKEIERITLEIDRATSKLNNKGFVDKAPAQLVASEKEKLAKFVQLKEQLIAHLQQLQ